MDARLEAIKHAAAWLEAAINREDYADALNWGATLRLRLAEADALMITKIHNR
jgi:hypothetical protein